MLNKTPPNGVPKDRVIPAAAAAASILFLQEMDLFIDAKCGIFNNRLQIRQEKCTKGPPFPTEAPKIIQENLIKNLIKENFLYFYI